jgi:hypothetical protein
VAVLDGSYLTITREKFDYVESGEIALSQDMSCAAELSSLSAAALLLSSELDIFKIKETNVDEVREYY